MHADNHQQRDRTDRTGRTSAARPRPPVSDRLQPVTAALPGLATCAVAVALAVGLARLVPYASALLVAIVLGIVLRNSVPVLPAALDAGLAVAAKPLLRIGIVLLGAQLLLGEILALGWGVIAVVVAVIGTGFLAAVQLGRALGVPRQLALLIGAGFSICGAAAVAGVASTIRAKKADVAVAIALVVLFGTVMIAAVPLLARLLGLPEAVAGLWAGAATHEVAQVVAIGGILGPEALEPAVVVKLARVLMLAPVVALLAVTTGRSVAGDSRGSAGPRPPVVPAFVIGFLALAAARTLGWLPGWAIEAAGTGQLVCLSAAMFALGCGVHVKSLVAVGWRPLVLAGLVTVVVAAVASAGVLLVAG